ncbi:hypothetical protein [Roseospirillum parvum]|uniref:Uncharacterized protein n=1 Tax=Roseospirillum parvum TaxID=83401 RepID=A0A1G7U6N0_9PROT|nr:hypothetical protein [Roseospirillum parvum]SDG43074.1 hypothetical protein SAMN05421742_101225 [Roseospirillum parvum]
MSSHIQIGDITPRVQYDAAEDQLAFAYPFPVFAASDMEVYVGANLQADGYTVSGAGGSDGGTVTFDAPPRPAGAPATTVTLRRRVPLARTTDFQEGGAFRAKVINDELDRIVAGLQQLADDLARALTLAPTDSGTASTTLPSAEAARVLGWSADGGRLENKDLAALGAIQRADSDPLALAAEAAPGTAADVSRADHVHPLPEPAEIGAEPADAAILKADTAATLSVGYPATVHDLGETGSATLTPDITLGHMQKATVSGDFTLLAPAHKGAIWLSLTNDTSGGHSPAVSAYATVSGAYKADAGALNVFKITRDDGGSYLEILTP